jgi:FkbM family methyltransferase
MALEKALATGYSLVNRTGILESQWVRRQFTRAYFVGKHYLDPLYANLTRRRPELFRGGHIIDVGANIGYMSILFARAADPQYKVYAFEPEPRNFAMLQDVVRASPHKERIVPVRAAVGQNDGQAELWCSPTCQGDRRVLTSGLKAELEGKNEELASVPVLSLDSFLRQFSVQPAPCFVKIRVQGYELPVCLGLDETIDSSNDLSISLIYAPDYIRTMGFDPMALIELLERKGFAFYAMNQRGELCRLPSPKSGVLDLLNSSTSFARSQLPVPEPGLRTPGHERRPYLELLLTKRKLVLQH